MGMKVGVDLGELMTTCPKPRDGDTRWGLGLGNWIL